MSENERSIDSNQNIEKIKVYDNDDAYLFGDASLNESNEEEDKEKNDNENNIISPSQLSNKLTQKENEKFFQETPKTKKNSKNKKNNFEEDYIDNSLEPNSKDDQILNNEKYIINEITTDIENNQDNIESNNNSPIYKNNYKKTNKENDNEITNENEENESEIPLITLNFLSICQCCKNQFDNINNIPYLFKCGHFFCKECIEERFTDEEGIKCPNDGLIGKDISELKLLNNFINDKPTKQQIKTKNNYCQYHKGQNLTHYIEDTKEFICVYCAFERFKTNPNFQIIDINEKYINMENKIDIIIEDNQQNVEIIQNYLRDIKKNKENEIQKLNDVFNRLFEILKIKKQEILSKIEKIFADNAKKLSQQLDIFSNKLEKCERIKNQILSFQNNQEEISFSQLNEIYESFIKELNNTNKITLQKYNYIYDDEFKIRDIINQFGELKLYEKYCNFLPDNSQIKIIEDITNNKNTKNTNDNQALIKVNKEMKKITNKNSYKIDNFYHFINNKKKNCINEISNLSDKNKDNKNINNTKLNSINDKYISQTIKTNINKSSKNIKKNKIYNNTNNKRKSDKNKLTNNIKKYINNKKGLLLDMTSSTYGNSLSKIENHTIGGNKVNTPKSYIKNYKYNLSLGQNYSFNNIQYLNSLNNNNKTNNNIKIHTINKNSKSKNNKSITTPSRINLQKDNHYNNK